MSQPLEAWSLWPNHTSLMTTCVASYNLTPGLIRSVDLTNASAVLIRPGLKFGQVSCPTDALACSEIQSFGNLTPDPR